MQTTIKNYAEYRAMLVKVAQPIVLKSIEEDKGELRRFVGSTLYDDENAEGLTSFKRRDDAFIQRLYLDFHEIVTSYLGLRDIEIYIKRFPYGDTEISSLRYLRYHIENHMNEVYIFKERFDSHLRFLAKRYRNCSSIEGKIEQIDGLMLFIKDTLNDIKNVRGLHVHKRRFSDNDIEKLFLLEILSTGHENEIIFSNIYEENYRRIRRKWSKKLQEINDEIEKLLNISCQRPSFILFTKDGELIFPDNC